MITIIFGDNLKESRLFLGTLTVNKSTVFFNPETLDMTSLSEALLGSQLFAEKSLVIVENFLTQSKKGLVKDAVVKLINERQNDNEIVFWEGKTLVKSAYAIFPKASVRQFKLPQTLFQFLDSLTPGRPETSIRLHNQTLKTVEPEMVFFMLIRHFRLLLSAYSKENPIQERKRMLPWQSGKLDKQAGLFGETELKRLYAKLFQIEAKQKVGALPASVPTAIDFFIAAI